MFDAMFTTSSHEGHSTHDDLAREVIDYLTGRARRPELAIHIRKEACLEEGDTYTYTIDVGARRMVPIDLAFLGDSEEDNAEERLKAAGMWNDGYWHCGTAVAGDARQELERREKAASGALRFPDPDTRATYTWAEKELRGLGPEPTDPDALRTWAEAASPLRAILARCRAKSRAA